MKKSVLYFCIIAIVFMLGLNVVLIKNYKDEKSTQEQKVQSNENTKTSTKTKKEKKVESSDTIEDSDSEKKIKYYVDQTGEPYENTVTVTNLDDIDILVNKYSGLPQDYAPSDLVTVSNSGEHNAQMREPAAKAFEQLVEAASNEGFILNACSAFRSYDYQYNLYNNGVSSYGIEYADRYWTRPGFSEHQTGLSVDIRIDNDTSDLDAVRYKEHYPWLLKHMHEYGFILRYPDDKEDKTKIAPESWHLRYVGVDLATYLYENNLSLDEYYGA